MPRGGANITPLALSPALGIVFPSGFDFHLPLGDLRGRRWAGSQEQPASSFSLRFTLPSRRPGLRLPPPHLQSQVGSRGTAPSLPSLPAPARLSGFGVGEGKAGSCLLHSVCGGLPGLPAVLHRCPCAVLPARLCCAAPHRPLGSAGDTASPPSMLAPAEMSPGSAALLSLPVPTFPCWT